ncbi:MAG TPA: UbiA-like polyprenyltransferase [Phycisphaerae bacterium]|nr:UbiA-like polyprenyltransferase [Phycisphaerae bacterium]
MAEILEASSFLRLIGRWGEMIKFAHSVFALPFALMAVFLAARSAWLAGDAPGPYPRAGQLALVVVCMVAARSAAMTFNRIVDAALDARNPRTAGRPIPAGTITRRQAIVFLLAASGLFMLGAAGFYWFYANPWPIIFAVPVLAYLCFYSYTKRFSRWSHFVLGNAIAISPVAAWLAIHPASLGWPALLLMGAVTLWIGGFDVIYACQDIQIDRAEGLFSLPARMGPAAALWITRAAHAVTVVLLAAMIPAAGLGWLYTAGVIIVAGLLVYENALVHPDDFSRVNLAFFTVNGVISLLLGVLTIADCLLLSQHAR